MVDPPTCATTDDTLQLSSVTGDPGVTVVVQSPVPSAEDTVMILSGQVIEGGVSSFISIFSLEVLLQPVASIVSVTKTVPEGPEPQSTVISLLPSPDVIIPPVTSQSYE